MFKFDYKEIKKKWNEKHKAQAYVAASFIFVFIMGFGVGSYQKQNKKITSRKEIQSISQPKQVKSAETIQTEPKAQTSSTTQATIDNCLVKGNISSSGKKIFHIQGGASYKIVKPEQCFNSETEASQAGFVKALR